MKYRAEVDGLRAFSVLSVSVYHAFPSVLKGGFIGVDVFFVISGFLISRILFESLEKGTLSITNFYVRRVKRIFPALIAVMAATLIFGWFLLLPDEYAQLGKHIASGAGFVSNFVLLGESGYFDNAGDTKPFLHLWSLAIEEQFYLVWPLLLWVCYRLKWSFIGLIALAAGLSFALNAYFIRSIPAETFYWPMTRFWEILCGGALAWWVSYGREALLKGERSTGAKALARSLFERIDSTRFPWVADVMSGVGLALLVAGVFTVPSGPRFPGFLALVPVSGALLVIAAGRESFLNRLLLMNRPAVWIGLISYPLYLWHWPILSFLHIVEGGTPSATTRVLGLCSSFLLAWLTYEFLEKRLRHHATMTTPAILAGAVCGLAACGLLIWTKSGLPARAHVANVPNLDAQVAQFEGPMWKYSRNEACLNDHDFPGHENLKWWFCVKSAPRPPTVILMGNSFANHLYPGFVHQPELSGETFLHLGTCQFGGGEYTDPSHPCFGERQTAQREFIKGLIEREKNLKAAIVSGLGDEPGAAEITAILREVAWLEDRNVRPIVFLPHLKISVEPRNCIARPFKSISKFCFFERTETEKLRRGLEPLVTALGRERPNALVYDPNESYCGDGACSFLHGGMPLQRDTGHLSEYGSQVFARDFPKWCRNRPGGLCPL